MVDIRTPPLTLGHRVVQTAPRRDINLQGVSVVRMWTCGTERHGSWGLFLGMLRIRGVRRSDLLLPLEVVLLAEGLRGERVRRRARGKGGAVGRARAAGRLLVPRGAGERRARSRPKERRRKEGREVVLGRGAVKRAGEVVPCGEEVGGGRSVGGEKDGAEQRCPVRLDRGKAAGLQCGADWCHGVAWRALGVVGRERHVVVFRGGVV